VPGICDPAVTRRHPDPVTNGHEQGLEVSQKFVRVYRLALARKGHDSTRWSRAREGILPRDDHCADEAVGGRPEPSADVLARLDDNPLRAAGG
jgi:hypothetical protein